MLLVVDIGNTHTVLGIYADRNSECLHHWRLASDRKKTEDEYAVLLLAMLQAEGLQLSQLQAATVSSTVPPLVDVWQKLCRKYLQVVPLVISVDTLSLLHV